MCAVFMIVGRIIRLGFIANFLSRSVLIGFLTGVGIQVAMGQVGIILCLEASRIARNNAEDVDHELFYDDPAWQAAARSAGVDTNTRERATGISSLRHV